MTKQAIDAFSHADWAFGSELKFGQNNSLRREVGFGVESASPSTCICCVPPLRQDILRAGERTALGGSVLHSKYAFAVCLPAGLYEVLQRQRICVHHGKRLAAHGPLHRFIGKGV